MVTKSRLSPFANTKGQQGGRERKGAPLHSSPAKSNNYQRWVSLIEAATSSQRRGLLPPVKTLRKTLLFSSELHRTLYGFIVFEISWAHVRGMNYLNELQTDTSLAIEAKIMRRWEFDSIAHAAQCMSSWFSGTSPERLCLRKYLDSMIGELHVTSNHVHEDHNNCNNSNEGVTSSSSSCCNCRNYSDNSEMVQDNTSPDPHSPPNEARQYHDIFILFRFMDPHLPFKLREIVMSDLRLLTLLEAGLPSWVIFLQSYPVFCHVYRPWMCPLARALYVLISIVTVVIGFYDLYKNVPVLKATASRLCGPLFTWIETWEMVSRIKYLGTMLFLHNFQKAVTWFLMVLRPTRSFISVIAAPLIKPFVDFFEYLLPPWAMFIDLLESSCTIFMDATGSLCSMIGTTMEIVLWPIWFVVSTTLKIVNLAVYPLLWVFWEVLLAPIRLVVGLANGLAMMCVWALELGADIGKLVSSIVQLASDHEATVTTHEISLWRSLWNDLFSQVFRALRSILNGFVAFFMACNRHRLSTYNHMQELLGRLAGRAPRQQLSAATNDRPAHETRFLASRKIRID